MHTRALRLLPAATREKWFFVEATLNRVLGGYLRGQILVALTVGIAAGAGCALLGVHYALVIGLLAFLFEFIPIVGPVLGMIPAVLIALFQSPGLALWVVIYFILLQQVETHVIVPRVSGHAVGLHPLGVLLALLAGVELGGIGGALLAVPVAGVLYVIAMALYSDATKQTEMLVDQPRRITYTGTALRGVRSVIDRRIKGSASALRTAPSKGGDTMSVLSSAVTGDGTANSNGAKASPDVTLPVAATTAGTGPAGRIDVPGVAPNERLTTIAQDQSELVERFAVAEAEEASEAAAQSARAASN
jgi:hypothetical protein